MLTYYLLGCRIGKVAYPSPKALRVLLKCFFKFACVKNYTEFDSQKFSFD